MNMATRIFSVLCVLILCFVLLPTNISAQESAASSAGVTLVVPSPIFGQSERLEFTDSSAGIDAKPCTEFNDMGMAGVEIDYVFPGAELTAKDVDGTTYYYAHMDGFGKLGEVGKPALPMHNYAVALPVGAEVRIEILESESEVLDDYLIHPALEPALDEERAPEPEFVIDEEFYQLDENYPESPVRVITINKLRGISLAQVQLCPVQYNPRRRELTVYSRLKFRVKFVGGEDFFLDIHAHSSRFIKLLKNVVVNGDSIPEAETDAASGENGWADIIIVTHSNYASAAITLAEWKRQMGYAVEVISQSSWTSTQVEDAIHDRYNAWSPKPDYFIIIGDHEDVPAQDMGSHVTDLYYACMDGPSDYYPDIAYGRISVSSPSEANNIIDKIVNYQCDPPANGDFYNRGINAAYFQDYDPRDTYADRRFAQTSWEIRQHLINNYGYQMDREFYADYPDDVLYWNDGYYSSGEPVPDYLRYPSYAWDGCAANIRDEIGDGRFLLTHRDHGGVTGWGEPSFSTSDIGLLSNGDELPVVFSINCLTGKFDSNCFCEAFLRHPDGGAVGIFGASEVSYSGYNDGLAEGFIDAVWPGLVPLFPHNPSPTVTSHTPMYAMGDVLNQGKIRMEETWGTSQYTFEIFHYFGDPSMEIWTSFPPTINATHDSQMSFGQATFNISDANCETGTATLYYDGEIIGKGLLSSGDCIIPLSTYVPSPPATALLTITLHNYRPYQAEIDVNVTGAHVVYNAHQVNDTAGNNNGMVDTGECILLGVTLENVGTSGATNVSAVLSTADSNITITDNWQSWGTIGANATSTQADAFAFDVASDIPDHHEVDFQLEVTGMEESAPPWYSGFSITVNAPVLTVGSITIDDSSGNDNGILDPGEAANVLINTSNEGHADTAGATATLSSPSSYVNINTPSYDFGTLAVGGSENASFSVSVNSTAPIGTAIDFHYDVSSGAYSASESFTRYIGCGQGQVGYGTTPVEYPFHTFYMDTRTQSILLADDIQFAGPIRKIKLYCSTRPSQDLDNFYIRMQHTTIDSFPSNSFVNGGWATVLHATDVDVSTWDIPGWVEFQLATPFDYNGSDNLLVDYCVDNSAFDWPSGECYSTAATIRTLTAYTDEPTGDLLSCSSGEPQNWYNNVILTGCPIPTLVAPQDGSALQAGEILFRWDDVPTAISYTIQIDTVETFDSPDLIQQTLAEIQFDTALAKGTYYWHVCAILDGGHPTAYSDTWMLSVVSDIVQVTTDTDSDYEPAITQTDDGKVWVVWKSYRLGNSNIWCKTSPDGGATWSEASPIDTGISGYSPAITQTNDSKVWVAFYSYESGNADIWYTTSSDGGVNWSDASQFTWFVGYDRYPTLAALSSEKLAVAWQSDRAVNYDIWYGIARSMEDINPPPYLHWAENEPVGPEVGETVTVRAWASDESGVEDVQLVWWVDGEPQDTLPMYDDGTNNDYSADDGVYEVEIGPFSLIGTVVEYKIQITDIDGNTIVAPQYPYRFEIIKPFEKTANVLLVADRAGSYTHYYTDSLDNAGYAYDVWDADLRGNIDGETLNQYVDGVVIWATPDWGYMGWSETQDNLTSYLDSGGRLFISGQDIGESIGWSEFYQDYLHANFVQDNIGLYCLNGTPGDPITDELYVCISGDYGANNQYSPSEINPISPAEAIFTYDPEATAPLLESEEPIAGGGKTPLDEYPEEREPGTTIIESTGSGALRVDTGNYKVVYFSFGFEAINSAADRATVMERVLDWLSLSAPTTVISGFTLGTDADDAAGGNVSISDVSGSPVLIGGYQAEFSYNGTILNVLEGRLKPPFDTGASNIDNPGGLTQFNGIAIEGALAPVNLAFLTMRLTGSVEEQCQGTLYLGGIVNVDVDGQTLGVLPSQISYDFRRGDARADAEINISDALFIAQYLAGLRDLGAGLDRVQAVNAGSVKHDNDFDEINISDVLFICQYLVGLRDGNMNPIE